MTDEFSFGEKLLRLYDRFKYVQKAGKNAHFQYKFFQESAIKRKLNEACRELGLVVSRTEITSQQHTPLYDGTKYKGMVSVVTLKVRIEDIKEPFTFIELEGVGGGQDSGDKAPMKAEVSALKYAIANGLMVETGDDPEDDPKTDEAAIEAVRAGIEAAKTSNDLEYLKPQLAALKGCADFGALKDAFKAKKAALTAN